jgi:hypothetical protein
MRDDVNALKRFTHHSTVRTRHHHVRHRGAGSSRSATATTGGLPVRAVSFDHLIDPASIDCGIVRPSALAVLRLTIISNRAVAGSAAPQDWRLLGIGAHRRQPGGKFP